MPRVSMLILDVCQNIWFLLFRTKILDQFHYGVYYPSPWSSYWETRKRTENRL